MIEPHTGKRIRTQRRDVAKYRSFPYHGLGKAGRIKAAGQVVVLLLLAFQTPSCKKDDTAVAPEPPVEPKLSSIQAQIFDVNGCSTTTCHGAAASSGLQLTAGTSFGQLVGVASLNDGDHQPPFVRVKPGVPDSSFLVIKLTGPSPRQGSLMPRVGSKISNDKINAIRTWILNGAQNN